MLRRSHQLVCGIKHRPCGTLCNWIFSYFALWNSLFCMLYRSYTATKLPTKASKTSDGCIRPSSRNWSWNYYSWCLDRKPRFSAITAVRQVSQAASTRTHKPSAMIYYNFENSCSDVISDDKCHECDWLTDLLTGRLTDCLTDWLTDWPADWLTDWLADWLTDWQTYLQTSLTDGLTDWLTDWLSWLAGRARERITSSTLPSFGAVYLTN